MNIYKLTFQDKEEAELTLMALNVIDSNFNYINGTQAVVYLGILDELNAQYCVDLMTSETINFGSNEIVPLNPMHIFAGHENNNITNE